MKRLMGLSAAIGLFWLMATPAHASAVYDFSSALVVQDPSPLSFGFEFTTNAAVTVSSLGYFDEGGDGFATAHTVGIYDNNGNLITEITLDAGTGGTLEGNFRYESIAPVVLAAGKSYVLAATTGGAADAWAYGIAGDSLLGLTVNPIITIASDAGRFVYQQGNELQDPTGQFIYTLYAGPNFGIDEAAAPEPASMALVFAGLALTLGFIRKRKTR